jgi:hypothetical protein
MAKVSSTVSIAREDWDFSQCSEDKLEFCYTYEYAREMMLRESPAFLKLFRKAKKKEFDGRGTWHYNLQGASDHRNRVFMAVIDAPFGFPEKPYLKVEHHVTRRSYFPFSPEPGLKPWWVAAEVRFQDGKFFKGNLQEDLNLPPEKVAMFWIDWSYSPNQILLALKDWVDHHHPRDFDERRGKNIQKQLRDDLRALGAWRLIKALGTAEAAVKHTAKFSDDSYGLYKQPSGWSEAKKRARKILDEWKQAITDSAIK